MYCLWHQLDSVCRGERASSTMHLEEVLCILKYQPEQWWKLELCFGCQPAHWYGNPEGVSQFDDCTWRCTLQGRTLWFGYLTAGCFLMADIYADTSIVLYCSLNAVTDYSRDRRKRIHDTACVRPFAVKSDCCRCAASLLMTQYTKLYKL